MRKTALLMIDMQRGFIDESSLLCVAGAASTIPSCARVLKASRDVSMPIFHIRREYAADGSDVEPVRKEIWLAGGRPLCRAGYDPESLEPPAALAALPGEEIIVKPRFSAFFQTDLDNRLRCLGITRVVLIGTTTPNCIRTTCYDALSLNYNVTIIEDATSSRTPEVQASNIADMAFIGAEIISTDAFCAFRMTTHLSNGPVQSDG